MRVVIQRVKQARVEVDGQVTGAIGPGLLVLLGIAKQTPKRTPSTL
jgi:D-aminoacyl-tRNA deacylase